MKSFKKSIICLFIFSALFLIVACDRAKYYMTLDNVEYVTTFPHIYNLENFDEVYVEVIGYNNFSLVDSFLIFSTIDSDGFWSLVSLANMDTLGKILTKGQGPNEFLSSPSVQEATSFFKDTGEQYAAIYDFHRGKIYKINITETIRNNKLAISVMKDSVPRSQFNFVMLDTNQFLCKEINSTRTQQLRYIMNNNVKESSPNLEKLNRATVKTGKNTGFSFNIISTLTKYNKEQGLIIEMPIMLNYLNLYSIDEDFGKTICIGNKLDYIGDIQHQDLRDLVYTFYDLRIYRDFFGVVFINENVSSMQQSERKNFPSIFLFNWQGEPLAELKLNRHLTSFDIDFNTGFLYGLDSNTEGFFKYDINHVLRELTIGLN